jgi:hypothetical protein
MMAERNGTPGENGHAASRAPSGPLWSWPHIPAWVRVLNAAGAALGRLGLRQPSLDPRSLLAAAEGRAGLADWGDGRFREGLENLVGSFEAQGTAHTFGRIFFREYVIRLLVSRLRIQDDLKCYPEILDVPIRRPLFITGLPRTGTTLLHRLLSEDSAGRPLLFWETLEPSPPPRAETRRSDPRIARARKATRTMNALAPGIAVAHLYEAESPEECNNLFAHSMMAGMLGFMFDVPGFVEWLRQQELIEPYRYLRRQLQLLSWRCPGDHWILKSPAHLFGLDALLAAFPDACIVLTHRDPRQSIPSLCSLAAAFRGITCRRIDLARLGAEINEAMGTGVDRALAVRAKADPGRFLDVPYSSMTADPIGTAREVYRHFGYESSPEFEERMRRWLAENPQHKQGVHRYSLDQFGLSAVDIDARFANYRTWMAENLPPASAVAHSTR